MTGGSGRLGIQVLKTLEKANYEVVDFDLVSPRTGNCEFINGDISNRKQVDRALRGIDIVVHLAWIWQPLFHAESRKLTTWDLWDKNQTGSFNVFESAVNNNVKKVVYASSIAAVGLSTWVKSPAIDYFPIDEAHPCRPQNIYGAGKLVMEELAQMYARRSETSFIGLRFATIWFGHPDCDERTRLILCNYVKNVQEISKQVKTIGPGVRDLCYQYVGVMDAADACRLALEKRAADSCVYNIGASDTCTDWDSLKLAKFLYPEVPVRDSLAFTDDKKKPLWDITKAQREIGYSPKFKWEEFLK